MCIPGLFGSTPPKPPKPVPPPPPSPPVDLIKPAPPTEVLKKEPASIAPATSKRQSLYANKNIASPADTGVPLAIGSNTQNNTINTGV